MTDDLTSQTSRLPDDNAVVDLATIPLELAKPKHYKHDDRLYDYSRTYQDSVVDGLVFSSRSSDHPKSRWSFRFHRSIAYVYHELGIYPEMSLEEARDKARDILASIETQIMPPTADECAAYDSALIALKSGDKVARDRVVRGFLRIAQVPHEMKEDMNVQPEQLPPSEILQKSFDNLALSTRVTNALKNDNIKTVAHLLVLSDAQFLRMPSFGRKSLQEIRSALNCLLTEHKQEPAKPSLASVMALQREILEHIEEQASMMRSAIRILEAIAAGESCSITHDVGA